MESITSLRTIELKAIRSYLFTTYFSRILWSAAPILVSFLSFSVYTQIAGHTLDAATAFTSLALFNTLRNPLQTFPDIIVRMMEAGVSLKRVERFLQEEDLDRYGKDKFNHDVSPQPILKVKVKSTSPFQTTSDDFDDSDDEKTGLLVKDTLNSLPSPPLSHISSSDIFVRGSFGYYVTPSIPLFPSPATILPHPISYGSKLTTSSIPTVSESMSSSNSSLPFSINNVNVVFPKGKLSVVIGTTGSGKTSLLLSLLGEMKPLDSLSSHYFPKQQISYVSQAPFLQNATIRENILFSSPYDPIKYKEVVQSCALVKDFESFEGGDLTEIGVAGVGVSGGQKGRISLARGAYAFQGHEGEEGELILLDDPLSGI